MSLLTISNEIDTNARNHQIRHSLQPKSSTPALPNIKRHSSLGKDRIKASFPKHRISAIQEVEKIDEDEYKGQIDNAEEEQVPQADNIRISFTKSTRKISNISRTSKLSVPNSVNSEKGFVNYGYDTSTKSSVHGSMSSLPVIREQYCCCQRWTRLEKILAAIVAILALVIICLVITIGVVSNYKEHKATNGNFYMSLLHF